MASYIFVLFILLFKQTIQLLLYTPIYTLRIEVSTILRLVKKLQTEIYDQLFVFKNQEEIFFAALWDHRSWCVPNTHLLASSSTDEPIPKLLHKLHGVWPNNSNSSMPNNSLTRKSAWEPKFLILSRILHENEHYLSYFCKHFVKRKLKNNWF